MAFGLDDTGLTVPRTADALTLIRDAYELETTLDVDWDNDLVLGVLSGIMAERLDAIGQILQAVYDSFDENGATGIQQDNIARLVGVNRKPATKGTVTLTITGTEGTAIATGFIAGGGGLDDLARWVTTADATIATGETTVDVVAEAEEEGVFSAGAGVIDTIVTPISGVSAVTNALAASTGRAVETHAELRVRRNDSLQAPGAHTVGAVRADVLALSFVTETVLLDNPDNAAATILGVSVPAHSYLLVVLPAVLTAPQEATLLQSLYDAVPMGTQAAGTDVTATFTDALGTGAELVVGYDYGTVIAATIVGTLTLASGTALSDAEAALDELIAAHVATLALAGALRLVKLIALAEQVSGVTGATFTINAVAADLEPIGTEKIGSHTLSTVLA